MRVFKSFKFKALLVALPLLVAHNLCKAQIQSQSGFSRPGNGVINGDGNPASHPPPPTSGQRNSPSSNNVNSNRQNSNIQSSALSPQNASWGQSSQANPSHRIENNRNDREASVTPGAHHLTDWVEYQDENGQVHRNDAPDLYCGENCLYEKANQNLSLQALYQIDRVTRVRRATTAEAIRGQLGGYCAPTENPNRCKDRYLTSALVYLTRIRTAHSRNQTDSDRLATKSQDGVNVSDNAAPAVQLTEEDYRHFYADETQGNPDPRRGRENRTYRRSAWRVDLPSYDQGVRLKEETEQIAAGRRSSAGAPSEHDRIAARRLEAQIRNRARSLDTDIHPDDVDNIQKIDSDPSHEQNRAVYQSRLSPNPGQNREVIYETDTARLGRIRQAIRASDQRLRDAGSNSENHQPYEVVSRTQRNAPSRPRRNEDSEAFARNRMSERTNAMLQEDAEETSTRHPAGAPRRSSQAGSESEPRDYQTYDPYAEDYRRPGNTINPHVDMGDSAGPAPGGQSRDGQRVIDHIDSLIQNQTSGR